MINNSFEMGKILPPAPDSRMAAAIRVHRLRTTSLLVLALLTVLSPCRAGLPPDPYADNVRAQLVAEKDSLAPGQPAWVGVRLRHAPHWHTYWSMPGDAGLPTQLKWMLPPGYSAGPIQWPVPQRLRVGVLANYGYEGTVILPVQVQVPASAQPGETAALGVHVDWLVCNDLCIPGGADLSLSLPVRRAADSLAGADAPAIEEARRQVPGVLALDAAKAALQGQRIDLQFSAGTRSVPRALEFFPFEANRVEAAADQVTAHRGASVRLQLQAAVPVSDDFKALRGVLVADGGPGRAGGWAGIIDVPLRRAPGARTAEPAAAAPAAGGTAPPAGLAAGALPSVPTRGVAPAAPVPPAMDAIALLASVAGALLGGIILNLMPCVFPVLSLKLIGLAQHRGGSGERMRLHGAAYALGVVLSFLALAGLLIVLRLAGPQVGWGFQLQSPLFVCGLIGLFFLIGLNLLGTFEFTLGASVVNRALGATRQGPAPGDAPGAEESLATSFATGVLAAVVASPCTAPFMGAALGFALSQPAALALLVFGALGAGMALPYLVLTLMPGWLRFLPRPGAWMEHLKQVMAFPMFLTCVWLFWVLGQQIDMDAVAAMLAALVGVGLWAWATGLVQRGAPRYRWLALAALLGSAAALAPVLRSAQHDDAGAASLRAAPSAATAAPAEAAWSRWTPDVQGRALAQGEPVFVDFTAAWCITCQANKRLVLHDARVEAAFRERGVVRLQADWTRRDEAISHELARFARSGVPMYVLYDRKGAAHVLPEILSARAVLDALAAV